MSGLLLLTTHYLSAQNPSVQLRPSAYKYQVVQRVCQQLVTAFGEHRAPKLTLITDPASQRIAQFVPKPEPELFVDEKLYDLCRGFGSDSLAALAIVLGHELTHYYGKHADWFGFAQLLKRQPPTTAQTAQTHVLEAQADMQGVYRAFLAGYDTYRLARPLYTTIYAAYHLPTQLTGYPSREERIGLMDEQARKANTLGMAFETGLFFFLKGDYAVAQRCFEFVAEEMPTKEVLTNVGLCQLLRATQLMTLRELPFRYPIELETGNRLRQDGNRGNAVDKTDLLKQAVSYFQQAIDIDETYTTAYIDLAAALSMLGRTGTAKEIIDQLEEVLRRTNEPLSPNARLVRGISLVEAGNTSAGLTELERSSSAYELAYNQDVARQYTHVTEQPAQAATDALTQIVARHIKPPGSTKSPTSETQLGNIGLPLVATVPFTERLAIPDPGLVRIQSSHTADGTFYRIVLATGRYDVICSRPGSAARSTQGIRSGDLAKVLTDTYGQPQRIVLAANSLTYYAYDTANFFVAVQDGLVRNWFTYTAR